MMRAFAKAVMVAAKAFCVASFAAFCLLTLIQVINRYALGLPMYWTEEVTLLLFVWSVMIGLPVTLWERQEMVVDILHLAPGRLSDAVKWTMELVSVGFLLLLAASGYMLIDRAGSALTPALGLPRWLSYAAIPSGAVLGAFALIARHFRTVDNDSASMDAGHADYAHD